jgi:glycosyltransferase involved in cell wall biosynthesis
MVSPWPPTRSGIADYSAEVVAHLSTHVDATAYSPEDAPRADAAGHDVVVYQVGNDPLHLPSVEMLTSPQRRTPSVLVLHDVVLHHLYAGGYLGRGRTADYARALERSHGARGAELGRRALAGDVVPVWDLDPWAFPMSAEVVRAADAVIVHSRLARGVVLRERPRVHVVEIPHHVMDPPRVPKDDARRELGLDPARPVLTTIGIVTPSKRIGKVLEALAQLPKTRRPFLVVGGSLGADDALVTAVARLGLAGDVAFTGYLDEDHFWRVASAADVAVNLRFPTMGETSGAVSRLAGLGLPVVVTDVGWFAELPDSFAWKVPVGDGEVDELARAFESLCFDEARRASFARAALEWAADRRPEITAAAYARVLSDVVEGRAGALSVAGFAASELAALGLARPGALDSKTRTPDGDVLAAVAARGAPLLGPLFR